MKRVTIETLAVHADARGSVFEPLGPDAIPAQRNVHVVITAPGAVRGNHLHRRGTETMVVRGPALVRLREDGGAFEVEVPAATVYRIAIPPGVGHAVMNTGSDPLLLVSFVDQPHEPAAPDVFPDPLIDARG